MDLKDVVINWDGKSADAITRIYDTYKGTPKFGRSLVDSLGNPESQRGITWLIKHHLEQGWAGGTPSPEDVSDIVNALPDFTHWEAQLHVLQCLDHLNIPQKAAAPLAAFLKTAIEHDGKFVRAWAYHGWYLLAAQHSSFTDEALALLEAAGDRETAASAKVKIRNALRKLTAL